MSKKVMVFVGTSKGGFIFSSDARRKKWPSSDSGDSWELMADFLPPSI